jgi:2-polyprenyl-6-methoxyphenol hydroxylase-like FAD-dependent oxidoreductase
MRQTDVAIAGGGLAGSTAAAMLGRAGVATVLVDPHPVYPPDFRSEKIVEPQMPALFRTGLADAVRRAATAEQEVSIARYGRLVERRRHDQHNILYDTLVKTVRAEILQDTAFIHAKVTAIASGPDRQHVTLSNGEEISARLVIVANGLNIGLRHHLGMRHQVLSACHSISIAFDVAPRGSASFNFRSLTYYSERPTDRVAYLTLFPIGAAMRANLFVYRDMDDPWLRELRRAPRDTLLACLPGLRRLADMEVTSALKIRPVDLYITDGHRRPGVVLVGDAFATSCPAAGTGVGKVLTDVERLCNVHVPRWLATAGMGEEKISAFYDDPVKRECDALSLAEAYYMRSLSTDRSLPWRARRLGRFVGQRGIAMLRRARERWSRRSAAHREDTAVISGTLR